MGVPSSQLTTNFLVKYQLTTIFFGQFSVNWLLNEAHEPSFDMSLCLACEYSSSPLASFLAAQGTFRLSGYSSTTV